MRTKQALQVPHATWRAQVGTRVLVQPGGHAGSVRSVEVGGRPVPAARAGDTADVALTGIDMAVLAAGCVLCHPDWPAPVARVLQARVVVLDVPLPVLQGRQVRATWQPPVLGTLVTQNNAVLRD